MTTPEELRALDFDVYALKPNEIKSVGFVGIAADSINYKNLYCQKFKVPHYSSNISDAWELFEEMSDDFILSKTNDRGGYWFLTSSTIEEMGDTAPKAIARAYIKFKEEKLT